MKKYISVLLILLFCTTAYSQAENNPEDKNNSSKSITTFEEKFALRIEYESATIEYYMHYQDADDNKSDQIEYLNEGDGMFLKLAASYLEYSLSYTFDTGEIDDISDLKLSKYSRKYWIDFNYQDYKGFYIKNASDFGLYVGVPGVDTSELKITNYNANYVYIFSDDFSIAAAMNQTERQNTWDWSFLLGASSGMFEIESDNSLIPPVEDVNFKEYSGYKGGKYYYIAVLPGVALTIPLWNFFATYAFMLGGGYAYEISHTADGDISRNTNMLKVISKGSIGYNGDNCFALFTLTFDQNDVNSFTGNNAVIKVAIVKSSIAAGVRF